MSRTKKDPSYRRHKQSGQAIVTLPDGWGGRKDFTLGTYDSPESWTEYYRLLAEWKANDRRLPKPVKEPEDLTVNEVLLAFFRHADKEYPASSREPANFKLSLRPLQRLYRHTSAKDFGPKALKALQQAMADGSWMTAEEKAKAEKQRRPIGWCRNVVNRRIVRVRTMFKWAESEELVPKGHLHALLTVKGLPKRGGPARQTPPVTPSSWEHVQAVSPHCPPPVAAMLQLQWWAGMRSCEVRILRTCDIDRSNPLCWLYRPAHHKNDWREDDQGRVAPLGPECQKLLAPWLRPDNPEGYLFRPLVARRDRDGQAHYREAYYTDWAYCQAVRRAYRKAGVRLTPYQGRHAAKKRITAAAGLDAARAVLGQKSLGSTNGYAQQIDVNKATEVMARLG
jgi:integrase